MVAIPHVALLAGASLLVGRALPPSLDGLWTYGPWAALALSALIGGVYDRGRAVFASAALALGFWGYRLIGEMDADQFTVRTLFAGLAVFVPAYLAALAVLEERGILTIHGLLLGASLAAATLLVTWIINAARIDITSWTYDGVAPGWLAHTGAMPQLGAVVIFLGLAITVGSALWRRNAIEIGLASALAAFALALYGARQPTVFSLFTVCAGASLVVAVLQDSYRMAFRDDLTGLPGRRALNDALQRLGRRYTIAMIDVDHFKGFNDTYGHDIGDDVLKMVASHLARAGGGGRAFRYGGEEFTVLFSGHSIKESLRHLEALRRGIESHRMAVRAPSRPERPRSGKSRRGVTHVRRTVSVTVSIGAAERTEEHATPEEVIAAADRALYRAKDRGRNRIWL
jgi:diguanylate cyclase (GGDEF)-like protein